MKQEIDGLNQQTTYIYYDAQRQYAITRPNGRFEWTFWDASGRQQSSKAQVAQQIRQTLLARDAIGRQVQQQAPDGQPTFYYYDAKNQLSATVNCAGYVTRFIYDNRDRLTDTIVYANQIDIGDTRLEQVLQHVKPCAKDRCQTTLYNPAGQILFEIDGEGGVVEHCYDSAGRTTKKIAHAIKLPKDTSRCLANIELLLISSPGARETRYFYAADNQLIGEQDAAGYVIEYRRNALGKVTEQTQYATPMALVDVFIRPAADAKDAHTYFYYDARGQLLGEVNAENYLTEYAWSANGLLLKKTHYAAQVEFDAAKTLDQLRPAMTAEDQSETHEYDLLNRRTQTVTSAKKIMIHRFDEMGHETYYVENDLDDSTQARAVSKKFDGWGQMVAELNPRANAIAQSGAMRNPWQLATVYQYSDDGLLLSDINPLGYRTVYYYNNRRQLCFTINPLGAVTEQVYDAFDGRSVETRCYANVYPKAQLSALAGGFYTTPFFEQLHALRDVDHDSVDKTERDCRGLVVAQTDAGNYTRETQRNAFGEVEVELFPVDNLQTLKVTHEYDLRGLEVKAVRDPEGLALTETREYQNAQRQVTKRIDAKGGVHRYDYDRLAQEICYTNPLEATRKRTRDAFGRALTDMDALEATIQHQYNHVDRTHTITSPLGSKEIVQTNVFGQTILHVDAIGQKTAMAYDAGGSVLTTVDALGNRTVSTYDLMGGRLSYVDALGLKTLYQYDAAGFMVIQLEDPNGLQLTTRYLRDSQEREVGQINPSGVLVYFDLNRCGQKLRKVVNQKDAVHPKGLHLQTLYQYNAQQKQTYRMRGDAAQPDQREEMTTYDTLGRLTRLTLEPQSAAYPDRLNIIVVDKIYDALDRCVMETNGNGGKSGCVFDAAGNKRFVIDAAGGVVERRFDANGQRIQKIKYAITVNNTILFGTPTPDAVAALLISSSSDETYHYVYDADGHERFVIKAPGSVTEYRYDFCGRPIETIHYATRIDCAQITDWTVAALQTTVQTSEDDRHTYKLYNEIGQCTYQIDPAGYVTQNKWNAVGKCTAIFTYATALDVLALSEITPAAIEAQLPFSDQDRATYTLCDAFNRPVFDINVNGYVTQHNYDAMGHEIMETRYARFIIVPINPTINTVAPALIADGQDCVMRTSYDAAGRKVGMTDGMARSELYTLDALGQCILRTDKAGYEWPAQFDRAGRKIYEYTPLVHVTSVVLDAAQLIANVSEGIIRTAYQYDSVGHEIVRTVAEGTPDARSIQMVYTASGLLTATVQGGVAIDDPMQAATLITDARPEKTVDLTSRKIYDGQKRLVVEIDEAGRSKYRVHDAAGLKYEIDEMGGVLEYQRNGFGEVVALVHYANPITIDPARDPAKWLLPEEVQVQSDAAVDRIVSLKYNRRGEKIESQKSPVVCYLPQMDVDTVAPVLLQPTTRWQYNAFGNVVMTTILVDAGTWSTKYFYLDPSGQPLATVDSLGYVTAYLRDFNGKVITQIEFATPITGIDFAEATLKGIQSAVIPSLQDRRVDKTYNCLGQLLTTTRKAAVTQKIQMQADGTPDFADKTPADLETTYQRDAFGRAFAITNPNGDIAYNYFNALGQAWVHVKVLRESQDATGQPVTYRPLTVFGHNAARDKVSMTHYADCSLAMNVQKPPLPIVGGEQTTLMLMDKRGLNIAIQEPEGALAFQSFTATRQKARRWQGVTDWVQDATDASVFEAGRFLHEERFTYDVHDQETLYVISYAGSALPEEARQIITAKQYNTFGEQSGEGPGDGTYPKYWYRDQAGRVYLTNDHNGVATVHLYDARDQETATIHAAELDLVSFLQHPAVLTHVHRDRVPLTLPITPASTAFARRRMMLPKIVGLTFRPVIGDGHCLYRAVTYYLTRGEDVRSLRELVAAELSQHIDAYQDFIPLPPGRRLEQYIADIRSTNAWASDLEITILAGVLRRPIVIIDPDGKLRNPDLARAYPEREPVFVCYNGHNHYDAFLLDGSRRAEEILAGLMQPHTPEHTDVTAGAVSRLYPSMPEFVAGSVARHAEITTPLSRDTQLMQLTQLPYAQVQRTDIIRDAEGNVLRQREPAFRRIKPGSALPLHVSLTVGKQYLAFGEYSVSWLAPTEKLLEPKIWVWPKGHEELKTPLNPVPKPVGDELRWGVDLSNAVTDLYEYFLAYYYRDPVTHALNTTPTSSAKGSFALDNNNTEGSYNLVTLIEDSSTLVLTGKTLSHDSIFERGPVGVELLKEGKRVALIGATATDVRGRYIVDLQDYETGQYTARPIYKYKTVGDPLKIGETAADGTTLQIHSPKIPALSQPDSETVLLVVRWEDLPLECEKLKICVTYKDYDYSADWKTNYAYREFETIVVDRQCTVNLPDCPGFFNGGGVLRVSLYAYDEKQALWYIGDANLPDPDYIGDFQPRSSEFVKISAPIIYVKSGSHSDGDQVVTVSDGSGNPVGIFGLRSWMNDGGRIDVSGYSVQLDWQFQLAELQSNPAALPTLPFMVQTHVASRQLIAQEISLHNFMMRGGGSSLFFSALAQWQFDQTLLNLNVLRVHYHFAFTKSSSPPTEIDFTDYLGRGGACPSRGIFELTGQYTPVMFGYDDAHFDRMQISLRADNGDLIPILDALPSRPVKSLPGYYFEEYYPDSSTLYLSPLPETIATLQLQYLDSSLGFTSVWRDLPNIQFCGYYLPSGQFSGHSAAVNINQLQVGVYKYRLSARDAEDRPVDLSAVATVNADGWVYGEFTARHGGDQCYVPDAQDDVYELVQPERSQVSDRWGNTLSVTDQLGHTIKYTYNHADKRLTETHPPVVNTHEDGTVSMECPVITYGYDALNQVIGKRDPNDHAMVHFRDAAGQAVRTVRADKVFHEMIRDGFGRPVALINAAGDRTLHVFDRRNKVTMRVDAEGMGQQYWHNEHGDRTSVTNGLNETTHFSYDGSGNVCITYQPQGQRAITVFDRNQQIAAQILPDGLSLSSALDFFGNELLHTDLGGAVTRLDRNHNQQVTRVTTLQRGDHGLYYADPTERALEDVPAQDMQKLYDEAGHLIFELNDGDGLTTGYTINAKSKRIGERFIAADGLVHQETQLTLDALDRVTRFEDICMVGLYSYDLASNRRHIQAYYVADGADAVARVDDWYTYDAGNNMVFVKAGMVEGVPTLSSGRGMQLLYDVRGWRVSETTLNAQEQVMVRTLTYQKNGLLDKAVRTDGQLINYTWDRAYRQINYHRGQDTQMTQSAWQRYFCCCAKTAGVGADESPLDQAFTFNHNAWTLSDIQTASGQHTTITYVEGSYDPSGYPVLQHTDIEGKLSEDLKTGYRRFDELKPYKVAGIAHWDDNQGPTEQVTLYVCYLSTGNVSSVEGADQNGFRAFITNSEGRITLKWNGERTDSGKLKREYFFYDPDGNPIARYGDFVDEATGRIRATPADVEFDLNFQAMAPVSIQPRQYVIKAGDTWKSIAEMSFGDGSFASQVAESAGYSVSDPAPVGMTITLVSEFRNMNHNWAGLYRPYDGAAIVGGYYPNIPIPYHPQPKPKHTSFFDEVLETFVEVAIMAFAASLAGPGAGILLEMLMGALGGAAGSVGEQLTAEALGDQHGGIDWNRVGDGALTGAASGAIGGELSQGKVVGALAKGNFVASLARSEISAVGMYGVEYGVGITKHFSMRALGATMAVATVQTVGDKGVSAMGGTPGTWSTDMGDAIVSGGASALGAVIMGDDINPNQLAAQMLGTALGTYAADRLMHTHEKYEVHEVQKKRQQDAAKRNPGNTGNKDIHAPTDFDDPREDPLYQASGSALNRNTRGLDIDLDAWQPVRTARPMTMFQSRERQLAIIKAQEDRRARAAGSSFARTANALYNFGLGFDDQILGDVESIGAHPWTSVWHGVEGVSSGIVHGAEFLYDASNAYERHFGDGYSASAARNFDRTVAGLEAGVSAFASSNNKAYLLGRGLGMLSEGAVVGAGLGLAVDATGSLMRVGLFGRVGVGSEGVVSGTAGVEPASSGLLQAIQSKGRIILIAKPGTEEYRYLEYFNAEANVGGEDLTHIVLKENPSKPAALEEFLHGTQHKLGIVDRLGTQGAEVHIKEFMIRHQSLLGLGQPDVDILQTLLERDRDVLTHMNNNYMGRW